MATVYLLLLFSVLGLVVYIAWPAFRRKRRQPTPRERAGMTPLGTTTTARTTTTRSDDHPPLDYDAPSDGKPSRPVKR